MHWFVGCRGYPVLILSPLYLLSILFPAWPDPMVYFRLVTTTLSTCWSVFKDAPLSSWVQSDVLKVPDTRCATRCVTRCFTICAFKRFLLLLSFVCSYSFYIQETKCQNICKLLIVIKYFFWKSYPNPKNILHDPGSWPSWHILHLFKLMTVVWSKRDKPANCCLQVSCGRSMRPETRKETPKLL